MIGPHATTTTMTTTDVGTGNGAITMRKKNNEKQQKPTVMLVNNNNNNNDDVDQKQQQLQLQQCPPPPPLIPKSCQQRHHYCLFGTVHLLNGMKLLIAIGLLALATLCVLAALYFRRSLFVMSIPGVVLAVTIVALGKRDSRLCWPIIGISCFHLFLDAYATLIFLFFFFFKPLYIIMVLNWAFDTMYTTKTTSYYVQCAVIFMVLIVFFLFNLWQLCVSYRYQLHLKELYNSGSSTSSIGRSISSSSSDSGSASNDSAAMVLLHDGAGGHQQKKGKVVGGGIQQQQHNGYVDTRVLGLDSAVANNQHHGQQPCKLLNQPPMMLLNVGGDFCKIADTAAAGIFPNNENGIRSVAPPPCYPPFTLTQQIRHAQPAVVTGGTRR